MQQNNSKVIVVMYRTLGIRNGWGYQPVSIFRCLERENLLEKMYIYRITDNKFRKNKKICSMPLFWWGLIHLWKRHGGYLYYKEFFDKFMSFKLRNKKNSNIIFNYFPPKKIVEKLKSRNNRIFFFSGQPHPEYWLKVVEEEYRKIGVRDEMLSRELRDNGEASELVDGIIVKSSFSENIWRHYLPEKSICLAPLGVDSNFFIPGNEDVRLKEKIFLYVGKITCMKGVHYLIKAWNELKLKNAKLVLIGGMRGIERSFFEKLISQSENVEYKSYISPVIGAYKEALVFVFPSLKEGFGKVTLEAMSCGLPVITTSQAAHFLQNGENGFIIPERNIETLKKKILYFYNNPNEAIKMGNKGRKIALTASWENFEKNFLNSVKYLIYKNGHS